MLVPLKLLNYNTKSSRQVLNFNSKRSSQIFFQLVKSRIKPRLYSYTNVYNWPKRKNTR